MSDLGLALHEGLGVERDEAQAIEWLQKAAEHGDYYGAELLADIYRRGEGVPADRSKAETWQTKAQGLKAEVERRAASERRRERTAPRGEGTGGTCGLGCPRGIHEPILSE